jgi:hypothetical protein
VGIRDEDLVSGALIVRTGEVRVHQNVLTSCNAVRRQLSVESQDYAA